MVVAKARAVRGGRSAVRTQILDVSYRLFCRHGIRAVGVDTIVEHAGVAKMSFYRHFPSKEALVLSVMERREQLWTRDWLQSQVAEREVLARKFRLPYPTLMVIGGLLISLIPGLPRLSISPDVVFYIFLPPILYSLTFPSFPFATPSYRRSWICQTRMKIL